MQLRWLEPDNLEFPPVNEALSDPNGLLAVGGDLSPERLLLAYSQGIFPWYEEGQPLLWWSPDPRTAVTPDTVHVSRSMRKFLRRTDFTITFDHDFPAVIGACAAPRGYTDDTWITPAMQRAYIELHHRGHAHSVEVWEGSQLVGGLYGVAQGRAFFGESMFSRRSNASKTAFLALAGRLRQQGYGLLDCQMPTAHLLSLGAQNISRARFLHTVQHLCRQPDHWPVAAPDSAVEAIPAASILEALTGEGAT